MAGPVTPRPASRASRALLLAIGIAGFVVAVAVGGGLRALAVNGLPTDFDEDDYLRAGQQYATALRTGDLGQLTGLNYRTEHPPLAKIAYGAALAALPPAPEVPDRPTSAPPANDLPPGHLTAARATAALFGTLEVAAIALVSPLAALLLAVHTWSVKYTSQVMLEALPAFTSALCVVAWVAARRASPGWRRGTLLVASAALLGATVSGKYLYGVAGLAIVLDWWLHPLAAEGAGRRTAGRRLAPIVAWSLLAAVAFVATNPFLWPDPVGRIVASIEYFVGYTGSVEVERANFPTWQPLVWLAGSVPWHFGVVPPVADLGPLGVIPLAFDVLIAVFAWFGLRATWRSQPVWVLWLGVGLLALLVWPTKWPQYIVTVGAPLSVVAASGVRVTLGASLARRRAWLADRLSRHAASDASPPHRRDVHGPFGGIPRAAVWLLPGGAALAVLVLFPLLYQGAMSLTDFSATSIRDGLQGGVWRAAGDGLSGAQPPVDDFGERSNIVRYAGLGWFGLLLNGILSDVVVATVVWMVLSVAAQAALGIAVALVLARRGVRVPWLWRTVFILPWAIPEFVGALVWVNVFQPDYGWLALLGWNVPWTSEPDLALLVLLIAGTWIGWPIMLLAASAGLRTIPRDVAEAAALDGAGGWRRFREVTLPLLLPILIPIVLLRAIAAFNQFYIFWAMGPPAPVYTLPTVSYFIFNPTFDGQFALSAALNLSALLVLGFFVLRFERITRRLAAVRDA